MRTTRKQTFLAQWDRLTSSQILHDALNIRSGIRIDLRNGVRAFSDLHTTYHDETIISSLQASLVTSQLISQKHCREATTLTRNMGHIGNRSHVLSITLYIYGFCQRSMQMFVVVYSFERPTEYSFCQRVMIMFVVVYSFERPTEYIFVNVL